MQKLNYENIVVGVNASMKVMNYDATHDCGVGWHLHPEYEIVLVDKGAGTFQVDTKQINYDDGLLIFLGPDVPHVHLIEAHQPGEQMAVIQFGSDFIQRQLSTFPEFNGLIKFVERSRRVLVFDQGVQQRLTEQFLALEKLKPAARLLSFLNCLSIMEAATATNEVFSGVNQLQSRKPIDAERLEKVFTLVSSSYARSLSSASVALELGMTTNSFCRFFKIQTGKTFLGFLNEYRLERARELLQHTDRSVQEVMYDCGYRDGPYFSRAFKRFAGMSPTEARLVLQD
ncbi:hypothetical protein CEQ90_03955 [Lewinellaceae bacterium SD302]|nr:hypothetical protein CEQ90_03955 [Lewinellaceae bacterium SD302]